MEKVVLLFELSAALLYNYFVYLCILWVCGLPLLVS